MVSKWKKRIKHTGTAVDGGDALIIGKHEGRVNEPSASGDPRKRPDGKPRTGCGSYLGGTVRMQVALWGNAYKL